MLDLMSTRQTAIVTWGIVADPHLEMKVLGFVDERIPYFEPGGDDPQWLEQFQGTVAALVAGAKESASALQYQLRRARFAKRNAEGGFTLRENAPKAAFEDAAAQFWRDTETAFRDSLKRLHEGDPADRQKFIARDFFKVLRRTALQLFDRESGIDALADHDARRLVDARAALSATLSAGGKVLTALGLQEATPLKAKAPTKKWRKM